MTTARDYHIFTKKCEVCGKMMAHVHNRVKYCDDCKRSVQAKQQRAYGKRYNAKLRKEAEEAKPKGPSTPAEIKDKMLFNEWIMKHRAAKKKKKTPVCLITQKHALFSRHGKKISTPEPTYYDNLYFPTPPAATGSLTEGSGSGHHANH